MPKAKKRQGALLNNYRQNGLWKSCQIVEKRDLDLKLLMVDFMRFMVTFVHTKQKQINHMKSNKSYEIMRESWSLF